VQAKHRELTNSQLAETVRELLRKAREDQLSGTDELSARKAAADSAWRDGLPAVP
jgi:hypothetical protein